MSPPNISLSHSFIFAGHFSPGGQYSYQPCYYSMHHPGENCKQNTQEVQDEFAQMKKEAPVLRGSPACQKSYAFRYSKSPSADCESKIGDMRGDFRVILLAKSLPYTNERPGGPPVTRPVSECNTSKKCLKHFFDTLRSPGSSGLHMFSAASAQKSPAWPSPARLPDSRRRT